MVVDLVASSSDDRPVRHRGHRLQICCGGTSYPSPGLRETRGFVREFAAYRVWRIAVERLGVLVCQMPGKGLGDVRGTAIVHFPLPVVGISSKELSLRKPFTLLHEVVHLALAADEEKPAL